MLNVVAMNGRITKDVELQELNGGTKLTAFTLAVTRDFKDKQSGEYKADFVRVKAFGKTAETLSNYTHKGSLISIAGRVETGSYENQQGQMVYTTDIIANSFGFLESKGQQSNNQSTNDPFASNGQSIDIDSDDLPF